jgi:hypothetical protein
LSSGIIHFLDTAPVHRTCSSHPRSIPGPRFVGYWLGDTLAHYDFLLIMIFSLHISASQNGEALHDNLSVNEEHANSVRGQIDSSGSSSKRCTRSFRIVISGAK